MSDEAVRQQYEAYPYPPRDPVDESKRLIEGSPSHLLEIDHYVFAGGQDRPANFRALIAGGGTGDATIMLAQQLADRGRPAEIHYLDLSAASRAIAEARAKARGLSAIRFHRGRIEDLSALGLGRFDYIDCCGVLHHLADPSAGLAILVDALQPSGGIGLMVYGALGRAGVYETQAMLRQLAADAPDAERLDLARRLVSQLPATHPLARNPAVGDHLRAGQAGLYDLLLHRRDRAYLLPELWAMVEAAGLAVTGLIEPWRYDPASYLTDRRLLDRLAGEGTLARAAFAELLCGNLKTHILYAVPKPRADLALARPTPEAVPVLRGTDGPTLAQQMRAGGKITVRADGLEAKFPLPAGAGPILGLVDGHRSIAEIGRALAESDPRRWTEPAFATAFADAYRLFNGLNRLFLTA